MAENERASFGFYPQLKRNRTVQDPEAAKNAPLAALRGFISGVAGAPGDLESLAYMPYDYLRAPKMSELVTGEKKTKTFFPTSEEIEKRIPFRGESPVEKAFAGAGQLGGGFYTGRGSPLRVLAESPQIFKKAGTDFAQALSPVNVIKPTGGDWLSGWPKRSLDYIRNSRDLNDHPKKQMAQMKETYTPEVLERLSPETQASVKAGFEELDRRIALNNWIDSNLTNYIKKEMGTPDDPVRKLAEEGISHLPKDLQNLDNVWTPEELAQTRLSQGFPEEGVAKHPTAQIWEQMTDQAIYPNKAGEIQQYPEMMAKRNEAVAKFADYEAQVDQKLKDKFLKAGIDEDVLNRYLQNTHLTEKAATIGEEDIGRKIYENVPPYPRNRQFLDEASTENPWLSKLDPDATVYSGDFGGLNFNHILDVLGEDLTAGRIRPNQLNKVSMEQAVRRTAQYDQELADKINMARATARADLPVYKEYPDEGFKWIELNRPSDFASESDAMGHSVRGYEPPIGHPDWVEGSGDTGRLSYGYGGWEGIKSGRAKVYSLVDKKGQPHVTIETKAPDLRSNYDELQPLQRQADLEADAQNFQTFAERDKFVDKRYQELKAQLMAQKKPEGDYSITQIKGKQNAKPKDDYLPFVQDFVKSKKWSDVKDFDNTGFVKIDPASDLAQKIKASGKEPEPYVSQNELTQLLKEYSDPFKEGMKRGGPVTLEDLAMNYYVPDYNEDDYYEMPMALMPPQQRMSKGGLTQYKECNCHG